MPALALVALALAACSTGRAPADPTGPPAASGAEQDCGEVRAAPAGQALLTGAVQSCVEAALDASRPAAVSVVEATTEGDPVRTTFHLGPGRTVVVVADARADRFAGPDRLTATSCASVSVLAGRVEVAGCSSPVPTQVPTPPPA